MSLQLLTAAVTRIKGLRPSVAPPPPDPTSDTTFTLTAYRGSEVEFRSTTVLPNGEEILDEVVDWGDGSLVQHTRILRDYTDANGVRYYESSAIKRCHHSYKAAGAYTVTVTTTGVNGTISIGTQEFTAALPVTGASAPWGRFFDDGAGGEIDQFPGVDPRLLNTCQPLRYLDTTMPAVPSDPALIKYVLNGSIADLNLAFNDLAVSGGFIYVAGTFGTWRVPARPRDANGVRYETTIVIHGHLAALPANAPAPGTRITPGVGVQLPHFLSSGNAFEQSALDLELNNENVYGLRFTLVALGADVANSRHTQSGGQLCAMGHQNHAITFDRVYSYLPDEEVLPIGCRRDYYGGGSDVAWVDCWAWGNRDNSTDPQAIAVFSGRGPFKIVNCFLGPNGECVLFGGATPHEGTNPEIPYCPQDLELRRCHLWRDMGNNPDHPLHFQQGGRLRGSGLQVATHDPVTGAITLNAATPIPAGDMPAGTRDNPNLGQDAAHYYIHVTAGTGAGQGVRLSAITDATTLTHRTGASDAKWFTTPLDATSVLEIRVKIRWYSKNNFEIKNMRRVYFAENVGENSWAGTGQQYFMFNLKTEPNGSSNWFCACLDVAMVDVVGLNMLGGISMFGRVSSRGDIARHIHLENHLFLHGEPRKVSGVTTGLHNHQRCYSIACDAVTIRGCVNVGTLYMVWLNQKYPDTTSKVNAMPAFPNYGENPLLTDNLRVEGFAATAPTTPRANAYWFQQPDHLDQALSSGGGCLMGTSSPLHADIPFGPDAWTAMPSRESDENFVNPAQDDLWGAATDYSPLPGTVLFTELDGRYDWVRLKERTDGVRASTDDIPYQW